MKLFSGLIGFLLLALALCFALSNRQSATISLWPLGLEVEAPLYLLTLGTLFLGLLIGAIGTWFITLAHRFEARRLRKEINGLRNKIVDLQQTVIAPARTDASLPVKKPFWKMRA